MGIAMIASRIPKPAGRDAQLPKGFTPEVKIRNQAIVARTEIMKKNALVLKLQWPSVVGKYEIYYRPKRNNSDKGEDSYKIRYSKSGDTCNMGKLSLFILCWPVSNLRSPKPWLVPAANRLLRHGVQVRLRSGALSR